MRTWIVASNTEVLCQNEIKDIIPIRKKYGVYTKEDDAIVQEIKYYFMGIHFLLKKLDSL